MREKLVPLGIALRRVALWGVGVIYLAIGVVVWRLGAGHDSFAYWWAWHHHPMYGIAPRHFGAFLYSPAFAQVIWPLAQLSWQGFFWIWTVGSFAAYAWLLWPLKLRHRVPLLCLCVPQVIQGNVWPALAIALVFGFRRPTAWAAPLLLKVTAAMGFIWFAARREWRPFMRACAAAAVLAGISAAISPQLWAGWFHLLVHGGSATTPKFTGGGPTIPLTVRLPLALALAVYGARRDRVVFIALAVAIGSPVFDTGLTLSNFFVLAALPRLLRSERYALPSTSPMSPDAPAAGSIEAPAPAH